MLSKGWSFAIKQAVVYLFFIFRKKQMPFQVKVFMIKLILLVALGPLIALLMVKYADLAVEAWKTNNRKKKWVVMCFIVAAIAGLSGWFR